MKPVELFVVIAIVGILFFFLLCGGAAFLVQVPLLVFLGWVAFLKNTVPQMTTEPLALAVGAAALASVTALAHGLMRGFFRQMRSPESPQRSWKFRWTLAGVGGMLAMSAAGIAMLVSVHQLGWLVRSSQPWLERSSVAAYRWQSQNNLKQIGLAAYNYRERSSVFPSGGTFNEFGEPMHSWETSLLPYLEMGEQFAIDPNVPWNHPTNAPQFKKPLHPFLNAFFREDLFNGEGYAVSHYAANGRALRGNGSLRWEEPADGAATTIMAGEVCAGFRPWGDPVNWRDPALGLNASPDGFGGPPSQGGAQMLMMDGSVRFLRSDIDPKILQALSTPGGGEILDTDWDN